MPSQPFDTGWDFSPVLDLIDSDVHDVGSPGLRGRRRSRSQDEAENGETSNIGVRLGSFSKLFEQLGLAVGLSAPPLPPFDPESDLSNSDDALLPSPVEDTLSLNSKPKEDLKPIKNNKKSKKLTINTTHEEEVDVVLEDKEQLQSPAASRQSSTGSPKKKKHQSRKEAEKERKDKQLVEKEQARNEKGQKANEKAQKPVETPVVENLANESRYPLRSKAIEQPAPVHLPVPAHSTKAGGQLQAKDVEALAQSSSSRTKATEKAAPTAAAKSNVQSQSKVVNAATQESSRNKAIEQSAHIPALKSGTHSQSKVGAQVRPTTPVQVNPQTHKRKKSGKQDKLCKGNKPSVLPITTEAVTPPHQTSAFQHLNFAPQHSTTQLFTPQTFVPNEYAQYNSFGTPAPYQYPVAPEVLLQLQSSGVLYTPMIPVGQINGLVPSTIQPHIQQNYQTQQTYQRAPAPVTPVRQATIMIRPQIDRHFHFLNQLMLNFPQDKKFLVSPMQLCNEKTTAEGIHIFVDASNIMIGFKDILRQYGKVPYDMSFDSLALLMERRRPVAKRVFAGSHREANPLPQITKLVETSKAVGYESNVNEQVFITREETERKKFFKNAKLVGWNKAAQRGTGSGSDSEAGPSVSTPTAPKWVEQGVDEILHLKMCQSIIDTEFPTTMVLATGDGAEAEHSDGFLAHVERALKKGWKVELVSWRQQTSGGYKNRKFRTKWGEQFKIIELDEYVESLIDTP